MSELSMYFTFIQFEFIKQNKSHTNNAPLLARVEHIILFLMDENETARFKKITIITIVLYLYEICIDAFSINERVDGNNIARKI